LIQLDRGVTCVLVVAVALVAEVSEPLAAALATAPITSKIALVLYVRNKRAKADILDKQLSPESLEDFEENLLGELEGFAVQIVKGVFARHFCLQLPFMLASQD